MPLIIVRRYLAHPLYIELRLPGQQWSHHLAYIILRELLFNTKLFRLFIGAGISTEDNIHQR